MASRLAAAALLLSLFAAPAAGREPSTRTVEGEYNTVVISVTEYPPAADGRFTNGVRFRSRPGEHSVTFAIKDKSGMTARAVWGRDSDGDGTPEDEHEFCGKTKPIAIEGGETLVVWAQQGPCANGEPAVSTVGTVTATFRR